MLVDCLTALQDPLLHCHTFYLHHPHSNRIPLSYTAVCTVPAIYANLWYPFLLVGIFYAGYSITSLPRVPWCFPYAAYGSTATPNSLPYSVEPYPHLGSTYGTWYYPYGSTAIPLSHCCTRYYSNTLTAAPNLK